MLFDAAAFHPLPVTAESVDTIQELGCEYFLLISYPPFIEE